MTLCRWNAGKHEDLKMTCEVSYFHQTSKVLSNQVQRVRTGGARGRWGSWGGDTAGHRVSRAPSRARLQRSGEGLKMTSGSPPLRGKREKSSKQKDVYTNQILFLLRLFPKMYGDLCYKTAPKASPNLPFILETYKLLPVFKGTKEYKIRDFPGGPVVKTPHFHRFHPWSGN